MNEECESDLDFYKIKLYIPSSENKNAIAPRRVVYSRARAHVSRPLCIPHRRPG